MKSPEPDTTMSEASQIPSTVSDEPRTETLPAADDAMLQDLLVKTSRTFALAIPLLPQPTEREVGIAYLLFRIADTFEDASVPWSRARQTGALERFDELLREPRPETARRRVTEWLAEPLPTEHEGYLELLSRVPEVLGALEGLGGPARRAIVHHTGRTIRGMIGFVERSGRDGLLELRDVPELQRYCYIVAGIVGEMLTELFVLGAPRLRPSAPFLQARAATFGEALQLVNILKDSADDRQEGRRYLPANAERSEIFALARRDLDTAAEYVHEIQAVGGPDGLVKFTGLPVALARASLDRVEEKGPGAKITRPEVYRLNRRLEKAIAKGRPALG